MHHATFFRIVIRARFNFVSIKNATIYCSATGTRFLCLKQRFSYEYFPSSYFRIFDSCSGDKHIPKSCAKLKPLPRS